MAGTTHSDGWKNFLIGLGRKNYDKSEGAHFELTEILTEELLTQLYIGDGLAKKIIDAVPDDATRRWFTVKGDDDGKLQAELERIDLQGAVNRAMKWQRLYGGALIVLGVRDARDLKRPLRAARGIDWLKVYSSSNVDVTITEIVKDPRSPYFDDVEIYHVRPSFGEMIDVHRSRCIALRGDPIPREQISRALEMDAWYWGLSEVQPIWRRLSHFGQVEQGIVNIMLEYVLSIFRLSNLRELLAENDVEAIYRRMEIIQASKSIINAVLLGEDEEFDRNIASVGGVADILDRFMMMVSGIAGIPVTRLFGRSPAGQNSTGESDLTNYYDEVAATQRNWLAPALLPAIKLINSYAAQIPEEDLAITWKPLKEPTEKETVEIRRTQSEIDKVYMDSGVLDSFEVRSQRFEGGYSLEMSVEEGSESPEPPVPPTAPPRSSPGESEEESEE